MDQQKPEPYPPNAEPTSELPDKDARMWAVFAHLSGIVAGLISGFTLGFLGPLIIWLIKKEESRFLDDQGKEALNFQLTLLIAYLVCWALTLITCGMLAPLLAVPFILQIIFSVIAAMKSNEGIYYRYPMNIRMVQ